MGFGPGADRDDDALTRVRAPDAVLGRDRERAQIGRFLDTMAGASAALVIEGPAGVGKSTLIGQARHDAIQRGYTVLPAHPLESETPLGFSALIDLLGSVPAEILDELPRPQRRALAVALFQEEPGPAPPDPNSHAAAVLGVVRALAARAPVLVAIDDMPLLDAPTVRVLAYAARRLGGEHVGLLTATRTDWSGEAPPLPVLEGLSDIVVGRLKVGPLSLPAIRDLVARETSLAPRRHVLLQLYETSAGNPLFALELARRLDDDHPAGQLDPTRLPRSLERLVGEQVDSVPRPDRTVLLIAALAADPTVDMLTATSDRAAVEEALHHATSAGIVQVRDGHVVFVHPLLRSAVLQGSGPQERRTAHHRLVPVVERAEERARHLALGTVGPDPAVAAELEQAALSAEDRGACEMGAELADLAIKATPHDEPAARRRRMTLAAECFFEALDPERARDLIDGVIRTCPAGAERAGAYIKLVKYLRYVGAPTGDWLATLNLALEDAGEDPALVAAIQRDLSLTDANAGDLDGAYARGATALHLAEQAGDTALEAQVCGGLAYVAFQQGKGVDADLVARALVDVEQPRHTPLEVRPAIAIGHILHWADDLQEARRLYVSEYERIKAEGSETGLPMLVWALAEVEAWMGNWSTADALIDEGYEASLFADNLAGTGFACAIKACLHAYRGRLEEAGEAAQRAMEIAETLAVPMMQVIAAQALGISALSAGDASGAARTLAPVMEMVRMMGVVEPGVLRCVPDGIEALIRIGDLAGAAELLDPFEERARHLNRRWALVAGGRCRGLWLAGTGDLPAAVDALGRALTEGESLDMPFERARTLAVLGEVQRRARRKRQAADALEEALGIYEQLGAPVWAERTRSELGRVGVHPRRAPPHALTPAEERVVEAALQGRSNAEIAQELFMAKRTVETHLTHAYRKLGVGSRAELGLAVGDAGRP